MTKKCNKCKTEKELDKFGKRKHSKKGIEDICKDCINKRNKEYVKNRGQDYIKKCKEENKKSSLEYRKRQKEIDKPILIGEKCCAKCKLSKSYENFRRSKKDFDGYTCYCIQCLNLNCKERYFRIAWGLTLEELEELKSKQNYCCAICKKKPKKLHIDHNHKTGLVRELLCGECNRAIGYLYDNIEIANNLTQYLKKHSSVTEGRKCLNPNRVLFGRVKSQETVSDSLQ